MITARTKGTVAISPASEEFLSSNSSAVALNFQAWHNGGCPIKNFSLKLKNNLDKHWRVIGPIGTDAFSAYSDRVRPYVITGLDMNRHYNLAVIASSSAGLTEALYNFSTWSNLTSPLVVRFPSLDLSTSEYSAPPTSLSNHVTILLPIVISVLVLIAVLTTLLAFMRKQHLIHGHNMRNGECHPGTMSRSHPQTPNSSRMCSGSSTRSTKEDDICDMLGSYPMTDYHSLCHQAQSDKFGTEFSSLPPVSNGILGLPTESPVYGKSLISSAATYGDYSSPKRGNIQLTNGHQTLPPNATARLLASQNAAQNPHIYAEPQGAILLQLQQQQQLNFAGYAQPLCANSVPMQQQNHMNGNNQPSNEQNNGNAVLVEEAFLSALLPPPGSNNNPNPQV